MALVRGNEVFAQVVVAAGKKSRNRRIHRIEIIRGGVVERVIEGERLPELVYFSTTENAQVQNGTKADASDALTKEEFPMNAMFREKLAQVVVLDGDSSFNRPIHRIDIHRSGSKTLEIEGKKLPRLVYVNTTKNEQGQNVMQMYAAPSSGATDPSLTTMLLALVCFIGLCTYVIVAAIQAHRCFG